MQRPFTAGVRFAAFVAFGIGAPATADSPSDASPSPSPSPAPSAYVRFVEADLLPGERVADAYAPHLTGRTTNRLRATAEYKFFGANFLEFEYRRWDAIHPAGFVTPPLTLAPRFVPAGRSTDRDVFFNNSIIGRQHTYLATSTFVHSSNDGQPNVHADIGFGLERLPDPSKAASLFGSYFYYPEVSGTIGAAGGLPSTNLRFKLENYTLGGALAVPKTPAFVTAGLVADHYLRKQNAPSDATYFSTALGVGVHF